MTSKILIADDEPNILISLEYLMKREGYEVSLQRVYRRRSATEQYLETSLPRHHHVEQHEPRPRGAVSTSASSPSRAMLHLVALPLHQELERNQDVRLVVGNQDLARHGLSPSLAVARPAPGADSEGARVA